MLGAKSVASVRWLEKHLHALSLAPRMTATAGMTQTVSSVGVKVYLAFNNCLRKKGLRAARAWTGR